MIVLAGFELGLIGFHKQILWLHDLMIYHPIARICEFVYGIIAAIFFMRGFRIKLTIFGILLMMVPLFLYYRICRDGLNGVVMIDLGVPAFIALIITCATKDLEFSQPGNIFNRISIWMGEASYSFYMVHALILGAWAGFLHIFGIAMDGRFAMLVYIIISIVVSTFCYKYFEIPSKNYLIKKYLK